MTPIRRFLGQFQDSPTYSRDRANLISGFSIGTTGLLLNGAVLLLVLPLLAYPDAPSFRSFSEKVEFGQLLALILLGGATIFATLLIPLRLITVFWEPRVGRYFDQIILSGITPLRFVIGKATSQNLFLGLILFLLLPYLVLSLTLGGVDLSFFLAGLFLVWLYCMALALVTLWVSLYLNELLSAIIVIWAAGSFSVLGCIPMKYQPFVMTPFPMLIYPVHASIPRFDGIVRNNFFPAFASCAVGMTAMIGAALFAIYLGPLYGIIRENSTFGEVVRTGDSKQKRWFRFRLHIQRSSEIAFFYENRSRTFLGHEGLIRWGGGLCGLLLLSSGADVLMVGGCWKNLPLILAQSKSPWWVFEFHGFCLTIHCIGLAIAVFLFSHTKNTTFKRIAFLHGWTAEVSKLDTMAFLLFAVFSTAAAISTPFLFENHIAVPNGATLFPVKIDAKFYQGRETDFTRIAMEGTAVISVAGLVVYALQRNACLGAWLRSATFAMILTLYYFVICLLPLAAALCLQVDELRTIPLLVDIAPSLTMISPLMVMTYLYGGQLVHPFPATISTVPFYVVHAILFCLLILGIRRRGRKLRLMYLTESSREAVHV